MMKIIFFLSLISLASFAASIEDTVNTYYEASKQENIESYMDHIDTSEMENDEIEHIRELTLGIWEAYDTDHYTVSSLEYFTESDYSMAQYTLNASVSGAENFEFELEYVMLLHNVDGNWKVVSSMPYEEYANLTEESRALESIDYVLEEEHYLHTIPLEKEGPTFDGKPPEDLSDEINSAVESCTSDEYCASVDMGQCINGKCSSGQRTGTSEEDVCGPGVVLLLIIALALFLKNQ